MPSPHIFSAILGLSSYWRISDLKLADQERQLEITVDVCAGTTFPCPVCGARSEVVSEREERWLHENFFNLRTCITAVLPLVRCERCGVNRVRAPWEQPGSQFMSVSGKDQHGLPDPPAMNDDANG